MTIKRGDMFYADLSPVVGSEQGGIRPVVIIQNDVGNKYSPTVITVAITSQLGKTKLPTHIAIDSKNVSRLKEKIGHIEDKKMMEKIDNALELSIGLQVAR